MKRTPLPPRKTPLPRSTKPIERGKSPNVKRKGPARRGALKDPKYLDFVRRFGCLVCYCTWRHGAFPEFFPSSKFASEAAHVGDRGLGQKCSDRETIPLCAAHHRTGPEAHHVLGKKFFEHHGLHRDSIISELNRLYDQETKA